MALQKGGISINDIEINKSNQNSYEQDTIYAKIQEYLPQSYRLTKHDLPESDFVKILNMDIHIDTYKTLQPKGRLILFHGVGGNGRLLSFIALPLMKSGFEVICPDLPLYGNTRFSQKITYDTWVSCAKEIVNFYQKNDNLPTFLFGLSAGGMLAYQVACECSNIKGLIFTCILDQRNNEVTKHTANNPFLGMIAKPFVKIIQPFASNIKLPMKWIGNMKAIVNNKELAAILMKDKKSAGVRVPIGFIHTMLNPQIKIEPEKFKSCPILLVHPDSDKWTNIKLSKAFFDRLACPKRLVMLNGAGHFPIEKLGIKQIENECIAFLENLI